MYLFNPDNDLALANFSPYYTPPASIAKLSADLSCLPLWYAPNDSVIAVQSDIDRVFIENMQRLLNIDATIFNINNLVIDDTMRFTPWGWNPMLCKRLRDMGMSQELLPTMDELVILREYSNRKNAVDILQELNNKEIDFYGSSYYFTDIDEMLSHLSHANEDYALKMPLSGSGRGLIWILGGITDKQTDWARRVIRTQGGIVVEPKLDRVQDFAMEFSISGGVASFEGYSLFETAASGAYMGNVLISDSEIENHLGGYVPIQKLQHLRELLLDIFPVYFPYYNGILGVDMMICKTVDGYKIQPCVEVNMRMNMGVVAHRFHERFVDSQSMGHYHVDYFKSIGEAFSHHLNMSADFPLVIENYRIKSGYMSLTPVDEDTNYVAWVLVKQT